MQYKADLHVHTVLSPCAGVEMIPPVIVAAALKEGISLIAITDHNSAANAGAVMQAARGSGLTVLPGMELQTREEVHLLCLFDTLDQALAWQAQTDIHLPNLVNDPERIGEQFIVDETGDFLRREERMLITSVGLTLEQAVQGVNALGGWCIPAHVDRRAYGLIPVLGLVPPLFDVLELSPHTSPAEARQRFPQIRTMPLIQNGDVHYPDGFCGATVFEVETPTIASLRQAVQNGRFSVQSTR
ncbi:MAG: PHP domain-containing protein [Anaerolineales bacterium]